MMPTHINRYKIISQLGEGGMGTVYLAYDPNTGRQVAVKVLPPEYLRDKNFQTRFTREKKIMASLRHRAIVAVYDSGEDNGSPFIVMPLMAGGSLKDSLSQGPLPSEQIARILAVLADALDEFHEKGIIHRDLKPSNILFDDKNDPYIADFGLARDFNDAKFTASGSVFGTPAYMSPEQASNPSNLDGRSDIYSLGCILFEMLTGKHPYHEVATGLVLLFHHANSPIPRLDTLRSGLAPGWQVIINKAMAKTPEGRYSTAKELSDAVQELVYRPQREPQPGPNRLLLAILFGLFGALVIGSIFFFMSEGPTPSETPTIALQPNPTAVTREAAKDGMVQVYVSAGEFAMGSLNDDNEAFPAEKPRHTVDLDAYWIDQHEVTNKMYRQCFENGECVEPSEPEAAENRYLNPEFANYPVTNVSWDDANSYCTWAGRRLPTEAEWEKAARGTDGRIYPWGNQDIANNLSNFCDVSCESGFTDSSIDDGYPETAPVGRFPAGQSPYGALDMAGNVSEWVSDWYDENYYQNTPERNPSGPESGRQRVLRGGSWFNEPRLLRAAYRSQKPPTSRNAYSGIRCASSP